MMGPTSTVKTGSPSAVRSKATQPATPCLPWTEAPSTPTIAPLTVMSAARICSACDRSPFHKSAHPWHRANAVSRSVVAVFIAPPRWGCMRSPVAPYHGSYEHRLVSHVVAATGQVAFRQGELASRILGVVPTSEQRRLFRPHDCSDLGVDSPGWEGIGGE